MKLLNQHPGLSFMGACLLTLIHGEVLAETEAGHKRFTRTLPQSSTAIEQVFLRASWGLDNAAQFDCTLINSGTETWNEIKADGGCTCLKINIEQVPKSGIAPGATVTLAVVYEKPDTPRIVQRVIRMSIDGLRAEIPVVVAWEAPLVLEKTKQEGDDAWVASGRLSDEFEVASIESMSTDVDIRSWDATLREFEIRLRARVRTTKYCTVRCIVKPTSDDTKRPVEQILEFSLASSDPRSIPSRLVCKLDSSGRLCGSTRVLFPRARRATRPDLRGCELTTQAGGRIPVNATIEELGTVAMKIDFVSTLPLPSAFTQKESRVRFQFNDGSTVNCPFQIEQEENE